MKPVFAPLVALITLCATVLHADPPAYEDSWLVYMSEVEGAPATVVVNEGIAPVLQAFLPAQEVVLVLTFAQTRPDGFPVSAELETFYVLDDALFAFLADSDAEYLGRVLSAGTARMHLLVPVGADVAPLGKALEDICARHGFACMMTITQGDPLDSYQRVLQPTVAERARLADEDVLRALAEQGDDAQAMREVMHWAYFPTLPKASAFAAWIKQAGYRLEERLTHAGEELPHMVRFAHQGTMIPDYILTHTGRLATQAEKLGGVYDGWETQVIRPGE